MTTIGDRLKTLRLQKKYTQKAIAEAVNITEVSYQRYEYGTVRPSIDTLIALADFFDVPLDFLVGRGIFADVDKLMECKDFIFQYLENKYSIVKKYNLSKLDYISLLRVFDLLIEKIDINGDEITIFPRI